MLNKRGFTLIELLIVMLIISIVSGATIMMISRNQNTRIGVFAKELTNLLSLAETEAMLKPAVIGLVFSNDAYQFDEYQQDKWQPSPESVLKRHRLPSGLALTLKIENKAITAAEDINSAKPDLIISNSGDIPAFVILIGNQNEAPLYQIIGEGNGKIHSEALSK